MPDNPWLASDRQIAFRAVIHKSDAPWTSTTGNRYPILTVTQDNVVLYTVNEQNGGEGIPLGSTVAASYMMELDNSDKAYTPAMFTNCRVTAHIGISEDGTNITWVPFGVWFVDSVSAPEQSAIITLTGLDALSILFDKPYSLPTGHVYTFGQIASMICGKLNVPLVSDTFSGYDNDFDLTGGTDALPASSDSVTYRNLIGYFAAAAGGYARMTKDGQLTIESYVRENVPLHELTPSQYFEYTPTGVEPFYFNRLQADHWVYDVGTEEMQVTRTDIYINQSIDPSANTTIQMSAPTIKLEIPPMYVAEKLRLLASESASIRFMGDPACQIGDMYRVTDLEGKIHQIIGLAQSITYNGGLSMSVECNLPSSMQTQSLSYNTVRPFVNEYGQIIVNDTAGYEAIEIETEPDGYIITQPANATIIAGSDVGFSVTYGPHDIFSSPVWEWLAPGDTPWNYSDNFATLIHDGLISDTDIGPRSITLINVTAGLDGYSFRCKAYFEDGHVETSNSALCTVITGTVSSITATCDTGDNKIYVDDELDTLYQYMTVVANMSDGRQITISGYTISGDLSSAGYTALTISALGKTTTVTVYVHGLVGIERPAAAMTSNTSQNCVVSASSVYGSSYPVWRAFDDNLSKSWASKSNDDAPWIQIQMDVAMYDPTIRVFARDNRYVQNPTAGLVMGSNDGTNWTQIGYFSGWSATASNALLGEIECVTSGNSYSYIRIYIADRSVPSSYVAIGNITINGFIIQ